MDKFNSNQKIKDIVTKFPKAAEVFKKFKIDFCCGGDRPLIVAINNQDLDEEEILDSLNTIYENFANNKTNKSNKSKDWTSIPFTDLIDHIVNKHHAYLYENLPLISELLTKTLRAHGASHQELQEVYKLFHMLKMELDSHLIKEETVQYPAIEKYEKSKSIVDLEQAIQVSKELETEHTEAGDILKKLRKITNEYIIPADACNTYKSAYEKLEDLESDLFEHIHLENNILFPRLYSLKK
ncbi:MAG: protein of unknown function ScdA domain protein [Clostridia bacterium]|jgi:regulator of cell morphogenesis and NO signaling|nr:protein of unknown function ScdA domain protein [Clostridia bacterium]